MASAALTLGACGGDDRIDSTASRAPRAGGALERVDVVVHRSPTCPCCGGWQDAMRGAGAVLTEVHHDDVVGVKDDFGVPADQRSCHTSEIAGYFVEGHVPVAAVEDLLAQRPAVDGIALAGMPAGSPGMPGDKAGPLVVTTVVDGEVVGELGRY